MANEAETAIYNRLAAAPVFHPASASLFAGDWTIQPGDVVTVGSGEEAYSVPVYSMNLEWKGESRVEIQSTGNERREPLSALKRRQYGGAASTYQEEKRFAASLERVENDLGAKIGLVVTDTQGGAVINSASIVAAINAAGSSVTISADKVNIDGWLQANLATVDGLFSKNNILANGWIVAVGYVNATDVEINGASLKDAIVGIGTASASGGSITIPTTRRDGLPGPDINFNIADTQFYIDGVSAAKGRVYADNSAKSSSKSGNVLTVVFDLRADGAVTRANDYTQVNIKSYLDDAAAAVDFADTGSWSGGSRTIELDNGKTTEITIPATGSWSNSKPSANRYSYNCTVGGRTLYSYADFTNWSIYGNAGGTTVSFTLGNQSYTHTFSNYP